MNTWYYKILAWLTAIALLVIPSGNAALAQGQGNVTLPFDETGVFTNAEYEIRVPVNWNGVLLVYAHGYAFDPPPPATAPGDPPFNDALEEFFLSQGYALAGSSYRNGGWAVKEGVQNTLAVTNRFNGLIGKPTHTILWGFSMGSLIAMELLNQHAANFDGAVASCGPLAGAPFNWDSALALAVAYDVMFGWPPDWGSVGDVRDDVDFEGDVLPVLAGLLNPYDDAFEANLIKFEFIRRVTGLPAEGFLPGEEMGWLFLDMLFTTQFRGELEARAGGPVAQNLDHLYWLSQSDKADMDFYLGDGVSDALLAAMNAHANITAKRSARNYIEKYSIPSGDLKRPVITMHNTVDGLAIPWNEVVFADKVAGAGKSDLLLPTYVDAVGHCNFTPMQMFLTVAAMHTWLASGVRPDPDTAFPPAAGFVNDVDDVLPPIMAPPFLPPTARAALIRDGATPDSQMFLPLLQR